MTPFKPSTQQQQDSRLESIWSLLKFDHVRQLLLCCIYRPPRYTAAALDADFRDLELQLQSMVLGHPTVAVLICGDLNCDLLKSDPALARTRLETFLSEYSLHQLVTTPTFSSGSLIDVCITTCHSLVLKCCTTFCHFSPHRIVRTSIILPRIRRRPIVTHSPCLKHVDHCAFISELYLADWRNI